MTTNRPKSSRSRKKSDDKTAKPTEAFGEDLDLGEEKGSTKETFEDESQDDSAPAGIDWDAEDEQKTPEVLESSSKDQPSRETTSRRSGQRNQQGNNRNQQGGYSNNRNQQGGQNRGGRSGYNSDNRQQRGNQNQNQNQNRRRGSQSSGQYEGGGGRRGNQGSQGSRYNRGRTNKVRATNYTGPIIEGMYEGILELHPKGYGFIRNAEKNFMAQESDPFVSSSIVEKFNLREGILVRGDVGSGSRGQGPRLKDIETIDGHTPEEFMEIKNFEELTPINPFEQIKLERGAAPVTMRVMDLVTPIGKGQRALIVAPPRTGKTMLLQDIADSVSENHPEIHLIVLLIDERPEEVTEMQRRVKGEVVASSMDRDVESHVRLSQLIFERGKRIAEAGGDVFILLDSITRTARAFNKWIGNTGRTMTGGLDVKAMDIPKKMFGTARRFEEGGSLTVCATALIDTGSRMDEIIFQEFKGTGNMELVLSRDLADRRIWPSIDITLSGTRREEKILAPEVMDGATMLRRSLISMNPVEAMEQLVRTLDKFPTNAEFLTKIRNIL